MHIQSASSRNRNLSKKVFNLVNLINLSKLLAVKKLKVQLVGGLAIRYTTVVLSYSRSYSQVLYVTYTNNLSIDYYN